MKHPTQCKFCRKPLVLEIDDQYPADLDPLNLIPLAACNHCADIRVERKRLERKINRVCSLFANCSITKRESKEQEIRSILEKLTKDYATLVAKCHNMSGMAWDEEFVNILIDKPEQWASVLTHCWKTFKQYAMPKEPVPAPYPDP